MSGTVAGAGGCVRRHLRSQPHQCDMWVWIPSSDRPTLFGPGSRVESGSREGVFITGVTNSHRSSLENLRSANTRPPVW